MNHAYFLPLCHMQDTHPPQARRGRRRRWSNRDNFLNRYAAAAVKGKLETREACASASIMAVTTYKANFACLRKGLPGEIIWGNMNILINFLKLNMRLIYLNSVRRVVWLLHHTDVSSELFQLTRGKSDTQYTPPLRLIWLTSVSTLQLQHVFMRYCYYFASSKFTKNHFEENRTLSVRLGGFMT